MHQAFKSSIPTESCKKIKDAKLKPNYANSNETTLPEHEEPYQELVILLEEWREVRAEFRHIRV